MTADFTLRRATAEDAEALARGAVEGVSLYGEFAPGWTLNMHMGHQYVANTPGFSYADWKLGMTRAFSHGYSVALGYYDTNAKRIAYTNAYGHFVGRATGVLTLSKAF